MEGGPTNLNRRRLLAGIGITLAVPRCAFAQAARPRIAWLSMVGKAARGTGLDPFLQGLAARGYLPGGNFELDECWGESSREALERLALGALQRGAALLVTQ